jgi:hypothetical protein
MTPTACENKIERKCKKKKPFLDHRWLENDWIVCFIPGRRHKPKIAVQNLPTPLSFDPT